MTDTQAAAIARAILASHAVARLPWREATHPTKGAHGTWFAGGYPASFVVDLNINGTATVWEDGAPTVFRTVPPGWDAVEA